MLGTDSCLIKEAGGSCLVLCSSNKRQAIKVEGARLRSAKGTLVMHICVGRTLPARRRKALGEKRPRKSAPLGQHRVIISKYSFFRLDPYPARNSHRLAE